MVIGIGCDIIEIERIKKALARELFTRRVYAPCEVSYCRSLCCQRGCAESTGYRPARWRADGNRCNQ